MTIVEILEEIGMDHANIRREAWTDLFVVVNPCAEHMEIGVRAPSGVGLSVPEEALRARGKIYRLTVLSRRNGTRLASGVTSKNCASL